MTGPAETVVHHLLLQIAMLRKIALSQKTDNGHGEKEKTGGASKANDASVLLAPNRRATFA